MKFLSGITVILFFVLAHSCTNGQTQDVNYNLSASEFDSKIKELSSAPVIDVRTAGEFLKSHIENAKNIDINNSEFESEIAKLEKTKPVLVYCLSGSRSAYAAKKMNNIGFTQVYNLEGGIIKWRNAGLKEVNENTIQVQELSIEKYEKLINSEKLVLIDFYAEWCTPCKKMAPYLEDLKNEMKDKLTIVKINADENKTIAKELKVEGLPTLLLYKNKKMIWSNLGFISKDDLIKQLNTNL